MKKITIAFLWLFWLVNASFAKEIDMVFQIDRLFTNMDEIKRYRQMLHQKGFNCNIIKDGRKHYLWCNEATSLEQMQRTIEALKRHHVPFVLVDLNERRKVRRKILGVQPLYLGYMALERGKIEKALEIFKKNYTLEKSPKTAYAYALALQKAGKSFKALSILKPYANEGKKFRKLFHDIALGLMYEMLKKRRFVQAHDVVKRFLNDDKTLHKKVEMERARSLIEEGKLDKALELLRNSAYLQGEDEAKIRRMIAFKLMKKKKFDEALKYLISSKSVMKRNKKTIEDAALGAMYAWMKRGDYEKAHEIVRKYLDDSKLYHKKIDLQRIEDAMKKAQYEEVGTIIQSSRYLDNEDLQKIRYAQAVALTQKGKYALANELLEPFIGRNAKAKKLYLSNLMTMAGKLNDQGRMDDALRLLEPYRDDPKIERMYRDIYRGYALSQGWSYLHERPYEALKIFQKACRIKQNEDCLSGIMYSYEQLKEFSKALDLARALYRYYQKREYALAAYRYAMQLGEYEIANRYYPLAVQVDLSLQDPFLVRDLKRVDRLIEEGRYEEARELSDYLMKLYGEDEGILRAKLSLAIAIKDYEDAAYWAKKVLRKDPEDVDARYALALYSAYGEGEYRRCQRLLYPIFRSSSYMADLYHECRAREMLEEGDFDEIKREIEAIEEPKLRAALYQLLAQRLQKEGQLERALYFFGRSVENDPDNFGIVTSYLYALKDADRLEDFARVYLEALERFSDRKDELQKIEHSYLKERLGKLFEAKKYEECLLFAKKIVPYYEDPDILKDGAWCAYNAKEYEDAMRFFAKLNRDYGEKQKYIYAFALSAVKAGYPEVAWEALNRIKRIYGLENAYKIAALYAQLGDKEMARKILKQLPRSSERDRALVLASPRFDEHEKTNALSVGVYSQHRSGKSGKGRLDLVSIPITWHHNFDYNTHLYAQADILSLDSGKLDNKKGFGFNDTPLAQDRQRASVFMPAVGIEWKNVEAGIGSTPIGGIIDPELTWKLKGRLDAGSWHFYLQGVKRSIAESMLSFVGEEVYKGESNSSWGRVTKSGFEGGVTYSDLFDLSFDVGYYPWIEGENVIDNSELKASLSFWYPLKVDSLAFWDLGMVGVYDSFDKNSLAYTYGHGGYFSPQSFWLGMLSTRLGGNVGDFYFRAESGIGWETFRSEDTVEFPLKHPQLKEQTPLEDVFPIFTPNKSPQGDAVSGIDREGIVYKFRLDAGYSLTDQIDLIGTFSWEKMYEYNSNSLGLGIVYRFNKHHLSPFSTFDLNHRFGKIIK